MKYEAAVLSLGNWGTALANHLAYKGLNVVGWSNEAEVVESVNSKRVNPRYQADERLSANVHATHSIEEAVAESSCIILALPSFVLGAVWPEINPGKDKIIVSAIKGLEPGSRLTPLQFLKSASPSRDNNVVLSGPSFAKDIIKRRPSSLVAASHNQSAAQQIAELFSCKWMKVYTSDDPLGVEMGGISKNIIAIAAGVCDGLGFGDSARAALITRGLAEMMRLAEAYGAKRITLSGLSGLGDLVLTASCDSSRNRTVGLRLGKGESLEHILKTIGSTAEGVESASLVLSLAREKQVEMPIVDAVARLLEGEVNPGEMADTLLSRPLKSEF